MAQFYIDKNNCCAKARDGAKVLKINDSEIGKIKQENKE